MNEAAPGVALSELAAGDGGKIAALELPPEARQRLLEMGMTVGARIVVTEGHIGWADVIFVMEKSHLAKIRARFPEALAGKKVVTLHIPDDYDFMQPELVDELRARLAPHVELPES